MDHKTPRAARVLETIPAHGRRRGTQPTRRTEFGAGAKATLPLALGALPFGIIFGALAVNAGLSAGATSGMSALVFAGSAQFAAAGLIANGAGIALIVLTTFVINLRHLLYAMTLAPHMKQLPQSWLAPLAHTLTDETFVVVIDRFQQADRSAYKHWFYLGSSIVLFGCWQLYTLIGIAAGQAIPNPQSWGLDFAMPVTFIGMLVPMLKSRSLILSALVAGASMLLLRGLPNQLGLPIAALLGAGIGALIGRRQRPVLREMVP